MGFAEIRKDISVDASPDCSLILRQGFRYTEHLSRHFTIKMKACLSLAAAASLLATVTAHGAVDKYIVGDTTYAGYINQIPLTHKFTKADRMQLVTIQFPFWTKEYPEAIRVL